MFNHVVDVTGTGHECPVSRTLEDAVVSTFERYHLEGEWLGPVIISGSECHVQSNLTQRIRLSPWYNAMESYTTVTQLALV